MNLLKKGSQNKKMKKEITFIFMIIGIFVILTSYLVVSQAAGRFTIGNEEPYLVTNTFAVQESDNTWDSSTFNTHDFDTSIRFNVKDKNPDVLNVRLCVGTNSNPSGTGAGEDCNVVNYNFPVVAPGSHSGSQGAQLVYNYGVDPTGTLEGTSEIIDLIQADCTGDFCTKTFYVDIIVDDGNGGVITSINQFSVFDNLPVFSNLYLSKNAIAIPSDSCEDFLPAQNCVINPTQGDLTSINIRLSVTDADADCATNNPSGSLTLCLVDSVLGICDSVTNNYRTYALSYLSSVGPNCELSASVPVGDAQGIEFYVAPSSTAVTSGAYKSHVVASTSGRESTVFSTDHQWEYGALIATDYPASVNLGDGDIQLGEWNPGTSLAVLTNHGNIVLNLDWDATDASIDGLETCSPSTATCWDLTTDAGLQIDDDPSQTDDIGNLIVQSIPETDGGTTIVNFQPLLGIVPCDSLLCDNVALDETLNTYFHIMPPLGLSTGDYETTIKFYTI